MSQFKRGLLPARYTRRTTRLAVTFHQALTTLGTPPAKSDDYMSAVFNQLSSANQPSGGPWGMYLNDQLGDCTAADTAHQVMLHSANGGSIIVPTNDQVESFYSATSGYVRGDAATDQGADEGSVCSYLMSAGLAGVKSAATGPIPDPANITHIKWAVQVFGAVRLGVMVDEQMEQQFSSREPWTSAPAANDPKAGGHDVPGVYYDEEYLYVVTWGGGNWDKGLQPVPWSLVANRAFMLEAHIDVFPDFVTAGGTARNGFNLAGMLAAAQRIEMQEAA